MKEWLANAAVSAAIGLVLSLLACFLGYRLQKAWIALFTFAVGFVAIENVVSRFTSYEGAIVGCALVFGLILAGLSFNLYLVGVFLATAGASIWMACQLISNQWIGLLVGVIAGFFLGLWAVRANRPAVIFLTGILGGLSAGKYAMQLLETLPQTASFAQQNAWLALAVGVVLAVSGVLAQFKTTTRTPPR